MFRSKSRCGLLLKEKSLNKNIVLSLSILLSIQSAYAAIEAPAAAPPAAYAISETKTAATINGDDAEGKLKVDDVNDLGFALQRIRQQAINIYVEALRKKDSPEVSADLPALTEVPTVLPKDTQNLLPFRRPWLVYFITALEPLIHLLKEDEREIENDVKALDVSDESKKQLEPLLQEWKKCVDQMDLHLTAISDLVENAEKSNLELAKLATQLDQGVATLEDLRDQCFRIVYRLERKAKQKRGAARK
jgi:hypothetical protein